MNKFFVYSGNYSSIIREGLLRRENWVEEENKANVLSTCQFMWKPTNFSVTSYSKLDTIVRNRSKNFVQVFNHFENIRGICTKTGLIRSLKKYYQRNNEALNAGYTVFETTPTSFIITAGVDDHEHSQLVARFREIEKQSYTKECLPQKHCTANFWLVKPANLNQGRGIEVFNSLKDIHTFLNNKQRHSFWVVQKYIEKPLLYYERKFDIRIWVIVTAKNEIFIYKKAYIRTSSDGYDLNNKNNYVHLTNNCLQQYGDNYGKHEDGNTLPMEALDKYFEEKYPGKNIRLDTHIMPRIKDLIIDTILCTKHDLNPAHRPNIFEFFGYDFMIDEDLRTWLIEVNTNPYLGTPNDYIGNLLPKMVDDMLDITIDHLFPAKTSNRAGRPNDYDLIYCESGSRYSSTPVNVRSPFTKPVYPLAEATPPDVVKKIAAAKEKPKELAPSRSVVITKTAEKPQNLRSTQPMTNKSTDFARSSSSEKVQPKQADPPKNVEKEEEENVNSEEDDDDDEEENDKPIQNRRFGNLKPKKAHKSTVESIYKGLHLALIYKTTLNTSMLSEELDIVLGRLKNWELISEKHNKLTCKTLKLIAQSNACFLLIEPKRVNTLVSLLKSSNVRTDIKISIVESINAVAREATLRRRLISTKLTHELIRICMSYWNEKNTHSPEKMLQMTALKCLINFGSVFLRRSMSPIEARDNDKIKSSFMAQGGLVAIWLIANQSFDLTMKEMALKNFLVNIDIREWDRQYQILEILKIIPETNSENEDSDAEEVNKIYESSIIKAKEDENAKDQVIEENNTKKSKDCDVSVIHYDSILKNSGGSHLFDEVNGARDTANSISFPKSLLRIYPLEKLLNDFQDYVKYLRSVQLMKDSANFEARLMMENNERLRKEEKQQEDSKSANGQKKEKKSKMRLKIQQLQMYQKHKDLSPGMLKDSSDKNVQFWVDNVAPKNLGAPETKPDRLRKVSRSVDRGSDLDMDRSQPSQDEARKKDDSINNLRSIKDVNASKSMLKTVSVNTLSVGQKQATSALVIKPPPYMKPSDINRSSPTKLLQNKSTNSGTQLPSIGKPSSRPALHVDSYKTVQPESQDSMEKSSAKSIQKAYNILGLKSHENVERASRDKKDHSASIRTDAKIIDKNSKKAILYSSRASYSSTR